MIWRTKLKMPFEVTRWIRRRGSRRGGNWIYSSVNKLQRRVYLRTYSVFLIGTAIKITYNSKPTWGYALTKHSIRLCQTVTEEYKFWQAWNLFVLFENTLSSRKKKKKKSCVWRLECGTEKGSTRNNKWCMQSFPTYVALSYVVTHLSPLLQDPVQ